MRRNRNRSAISRWCYDEATGYLTNKQDAAGFGAVYTYDAAGHLASRTWARGISTAYSYDFAGNLTNINYGDSTPDISFTYTRIGKQKTITDAQGIRELTYDTAMQMISDSNAYGIVQYSMDEFGRSIGVGYGDEYAVAYEYDELGRFVAVTSSTAGTFTYTYEPDSALIAGISNGDFVVNYTYEDNRNQHYVAGMGRVLGLRSDCYERFLGFFHSTAVNLEKLAQLWTSLALRLMSSRLPMYNGRILLLADGLKVAKSGRKMPGVKKLHQESQDNSKPQYIFGHSCQAVALVVGAASSYFAMPLCCRIHEGVVFSNRDKRSLLDKLVSMILSLRIHVPYYLIADAYYASKSIIDPLIKKGQHLISAVRFNVVAYKAAPNSRRKHRGRPRKYGAKVKLRTLFAQPQLFTDAVSPVYGESNVMLSYLCQELYWRPVGIRVRFILVDHPSRGKRIFPCTDLELDPLDIIRLYGIRFKIEFSFK
ncbi:MAG: hypothetical protein EOM20_07375 [Spartobacteria bacterium]|nr:hypothetical protein [Spartobacteria bacterium]